MRGKREKPAQRRFGKTVLLSVLLLLGFTVVTPWSPTADVPLASHAAAAAELTARTGTASGAASEAALPVPVVVPLREEPEPEPRELTDEERFGDAAFVGDSRTDGFRLYSGLREGTYFCAVGANVSSVMTKPTQEGPDGKETILDALSRQDCGKIYIMLGVNELGWYRTEDFTDQYAKVIDRVRADHPDAVIAIESILPVSAAQDQKRSYVNNARIREFNALLCALAEEKGCVYLDPASAVMDETGALPAEWTTDGVHLNAAGCGAWLEYLREHPL